MISARTHIGRARYGRFLRAPAFAASEDFFYQNPQKAKIFASKNHRIAAYKSINGTFTIVIDKKDALIIINAIHL